MKNEKNYLYSIADLVSDAKVENKLGTMYANKVAGKKVFLPKTEAKNFERQTEFLKTGVCNYCHDVYAHISTMVDDKAAEFYNNSAEYYVYALNENVPVEEIYKTSKSINEAVKSYVKVKEEDMVMNF